MKKKTIDRLDLSKNWVNCPCTCSGVVSTNFLEINWPMGCNLFESAGGNQLSANSITTSWRIYSLAVFVLRLSQQISNLWTNHKEITVFVDDKTKIKSRTEIELWQQPELGKMNKWFFSNNFSLNKSKNEIIIFSLNNSTSSMNFSQKKIPVKI